MEHVIVVVKYQRQCWRAGFCTSQLHKEVYNVNELNSAYGHFIFIDIGLISENKSAFSKI